MDGLTGRMMTSKSSVPHLVVADQALVATSLQLEACTRSLLSVDDACGSPCLLLIVIMHHRFGLLRFVGRQQFGSMARIIDQPFGSLRLLIG